MYQKKTLYLFFTLILFSCFIFSTAKADELTSQGGISFYEKETAKPELPNEGISDKEMSGNVNQPTNSNSSKDEFPQTGERRQTIVLFVGFLLFITGGMFVFIKKS